VKLLLSCPLTCCALFLRDLRRGLQGVAARQYDAWDLGMVSSDDFGNADVRYEQSFANIRASLTRSNWGPPEIPIVTGFLARGESTGRYLTASCLPHNQPHPACHTINQPINQCVFNVLGANWDPTDMKFSSVNSYRQDLLPTCKAFPKETTTTYPGTKVQRVACMSCLALVTASIFTDG